MERALNDAFFEWLQKDSLKLLDIISQYDCLEIRFFDGKELKVYFRGFLILTISDKIITDNTIRFKPLVKEYYSKIKNKGNLEEIIKKGVRIGNLQEYLDCAIGILSRRNNTRAEEEIRQEIARVNNRSSVANDTDYFIVDEEYKINGPRFDLVAIKWLSDKNIRKAFDSKRSSLEIVIFELKQGLDAVGGSEKSTREKADLKKHYSDFQTFISDRTRLSEFKLDIVRMFVQQASLKGFFSKKIEGLKHVRTLSQPWNDKEIQEIADIIPVRFGLILSDYKQKSDRLREQVKQIKGDFLFARSSFMGYGLYEDSILNREQLLELLK